MWDKELKIKQVDNLLKSMKPERNECAVKLVKMLLNTIPGFFLFFKNSYEVGYMHH